MLDDVCINCESEGTVEKVTEGQVEDEDRGGGGEGGEAPAVVPEVEDEDYGEGREGGLLWYLQQ